MASGICAALPPTPVKVEGGMLQGTSEDGLSVYRGVPFAAPPVGDLRWRAPPPAKPWTGIRDATAFAPACLQSGAQGAGSSEDCLYLNVLLLGSNSQELQRPFFEIQGTLAKAISDEYGPLADRALALYGLNGATEPKPDPDFGPAMAQWATDSQLRCGSVAELVWHTAARNPGYQFQFSRTAPGGEAAGAAHGIEVPFVFGTMRQPDPTDQQISAAIEEYWTNFAKTGDPNGGKLPSGPSSIRRRVLTWNSQMPGP
jgi:carboxylesterase type B